MGAKTALNSKQKKILKKNFVSINNDESKDQGKNEVINTKITKISKGKKPKQPEMKKTKPKQKELKKKIVLIKNVEEKENKSETMVQKNVEVKKEKKEKQSDTKKSNSELLKTFKTATSTKQCDTKKSNSEVLKTSNTETSTKLSDAKKSNSKVKISKSATSTKPSDTKKSNSEVVKPSKTATSAKQSDAKKSNSEVVKMSKLATSKKSSGSKKSNSEVVKTSKIADNTEIKSIKSKKRKHSDCENNEIDESKNKSTVAKKEVSTYVKALLEVADKMEKDKKTLFDSDKPPIFLAINCFKVPKVALHQHRILLPHSMLKDTDDVALFVKDLKRGRKQDYEKTVQHYEDILREKGCQDMIKCIVPFNQAKTEYKQFEMRRRLVNSYDVFLADGKIAGHLAHILGKTFRNKRKLPISVHMDKDDLKSEIERALRKTNLEIHSTGDSYTVQVGTCSMNKKIITENIMTVIKDLAENFPGGWENIRKLAIKTSNSLAIPIYMTLKNRNEVEVPVVPPKRPKAYKEVEGELSTLESNINVTVSPEGTVVLRKVENDEDGGDIEDDDDEESNDADISNEKVEIDEKESECDDSE